MAEEKKKSDPDNVFVTAGKKDKDKVYVFVPFNYRDAQAALKEAGATWAGSQWGIGKTEFEANETKIREAARADIALGQDGRKAREDALKAEKGDAPKAKKAEKKELSAEEQASRDEANAKRMKERDAKQFPVVVGTVKEGATLVVDGKDVTVEEFGTEFEIDEKNVDSIAARFGIDKFDIGTKVQFAKFDPEKVAEPEADSDHAPA